MGSAAVRQAMENGQIDVYWEYTGTSLITYNGIEEKLGPEETYETVKELDAEKGIVWLDPSAANNTYALAMRSADAAEKGISTISDLAAAINDDAGITLASNAEWYARPDGFRPLQETYGFEMSRSDVKRMDSGLVYEALRNEDVDVGLVFATDGRIPAFDFTVLEDDMGFFPAYALAPVVRDDVLEANPELGDLLNQLSSKLDDDTMARLNAQVDVERVSIENVAADFLQQQGLASSS
jgi:osmoprotectant transport system substrate-binding protein